MSKIKFGGYIILCFYVISNNMSSKHLINLNNPFVKKTPLDIIQGVLL